jgi:hypothetical protein
MAGPVVDGAWCGIWRAALHRRHTLYKIFAKSRFDTGIQVMTVLILHSTYACRKRRKAGKEIRVFVQVQIKISEVVLYGKVMRNGRLRHWIDLLLHRACAIQMAN